MPRERTGWIGRRKDREGLWARVSYVDEGGKVKATWKKVESKSEGKRVIKEMLRKIEDHGSRIVQGEQMTFNQLAVIYAEAKLNPPVYSGETRISGLRSYKNQRFYLKALLAFFSNKRIRDITHSDLVRFKTERAQEKTVRGTDRSITGVHRELSLLRAIFNFAISEGWLIKNPFSRGESLISEADETRRDRILTREEEERLLALCTGKRAHLRPLLICALDTGMRRGELLRLKWSDVDLDGGLIRVRKTTTKTWEGRTIGMTERLKEELTRLWSVAPPDKEGRVFGMTTGVKRSLTYACNKAGVEDFHLHDCRHTATTRMVQAGMPPMEVMKITGHKEMATFLRYLNTDHQTARRAASALDGWHSEQVELERPEMIN